MGCFINDFQALMIKYNMNGVSITANIDECDKLNIDTYKPLYNESYSKNDNSINIHKPTSEELREFFN